MKPEKITPEEGQLLITLYDPKGTPLAWGIQPRQLLSQVVIISASVLCLFIGTLLFFREVEVNRQLTQRLLWLETEQRRSLAREGNSEPVVDDQLGHPSAIAVSARVSGVAPQCSGDSCVVDLTLVPSFSQVAEGSLLLVLETEVPRIGAGTAGAQSRKRFFIYPGMGTREELRPDDISQLARKTFRFQRILETHTRFTLGKLLRPLALNVYLFDSAGTLSFHERYPIETD
jgi:hypothetical protein